MTMPSEPPQAAVPAPAPTQEEPTKKTPFPAAAKVVVATQLDAVRFRAVSARALESSNEIPPDVAFAASTRFLQPTTTITENGLSTVTTLVFQVGEQTPTGESPSKPYAVIQATLEARYKFKPDAPAFSGEELADFALCYCPFHVWGYWREFVQSSLARLDMPQLTIPLFLIAQAPQMVQDNLE